ncbi:MAG: hypothetical protein RLZZ104_1161, partial [Pseudomonadota bacterium]
EKPGTFLSPQAANDDGPVAIAAE